MAEPLAYEISAYELAAQWRAGDRPWSRQDLADELRRRLIREKTRRELQVYYYRIGYTLAFPLPLSQRPESASFPLGIAQIKYPWIIWLTWELDERWRVLHAAWRLLGDEEAGQLLRRELGSLAWDHYREYGDSVGLPTGHLAGVFSLVLRDPQGWWEEELGAVQAQAQKLLENDLQPWFEKTWADDRPITSARLHNYVLILFRAAELARVLGHPLVERLDRRAEEVFRAWCQARQAPQYHSEGTAYDGFLLDAVVDWLAALPSEKKQELLRLGQDPLVAFCRQAVALTVPGRVDLQAPLGDVEPQMLFWATVLARIALWYDVPEAGWLLRRIQLSRLRAAALAQLLQQADFFDRPFPNPSWLAGEQLASVTLRSGWRASDVLVAVGLPRCAMGHLHPDAGHVIIAWQGRCWITDPGYQQYRPGEERTYSLGPESHNLPVIGGIAPTKLAGQLLEMSATDRLQEAVIDMTQAYAKLPEGARVVRRIRLALAETSYRVQVTDTLEGFRIGTEVQYHWLGGHYLAWAFRSGWARLSDGERTLWIGFSAGPIQAQWLDRHPGSRGPLTLKVRAALGESPAQLVWTFLLEEQVGWTPPDSRLEGFEQGVGAGRRGN
jgi:hypothetical protein